MVTYFVACYKDNHFEGYLPVCEGHYRTYSPDKALEVAHDRVKSDEYDQVEVIAFGDPLEVSTPILFCWSRDEPTPYRGREAAQA